MNIGNKIIGYDQPVFFIAEVGQNHQGDIKIAKQLIEAAKESGADCVKFQKTDLEEKFTKDVLHRCYNSPNSWGKTYGEHKQYLEFSREEFLDLQLYAKNKNILFSASPMDIKSLEFLIAMDVPFLKIGSGDVNNIPMLKLAAKSKKPLIISTGMCSLKSVKKVYSLVKSRCGNNFALLHCVSSYPAPVEDINLKVIELYRSEFPDVVIGYSGHEIGIDVSIGATVLGAKIIERHITLDNNQKGSDHRCSLLPKQFQTMVEKVKQVQCAMGITRKICTNSEIECWNKLGKTIVAARDLKIGTVLTAADLKIKVSDPQGIDGLYFDEVVGNILKIEVKTDEPITENQFANLKLK